MEAIVLHLMHADGAYMITGLGRSPAGVTVVSAGTIVLPSNVTVGPNLSTAFTISLPAPAPAGGVTVTLSSSDTTKVTVSPTTVSIAAGQTTPATQPQVSGVNFGSANITASAPGYTSASQSVQVAASASFSPASLTLTGIATQNLTLNLSAPAPAGGLTINLSSSNTGVATVPSTVTFAANATSVSVAVTSVAPGTTTIHASALPNIADTIASVTVASAGTIGVPSSSLTVGPNQSAVFTITLPAPAPAGGVTVTLSSSDTNKVTVSPTAVSIAAGQTTPAAQPQVSGVDFGSAVITASAPGYTSASQTVQVALSISFSPNTLTITGFTSQNLTLNLSAPAPAGGLTINLSSSNTGVATVPATVNFAANASSVSVPVTGVALGTATIHASASPNIADTTASVTVVSAGAISVPATTVTVGPNQSATFTINLSAAAPTGGVTVTLSSNDTTKVMVSPATVSIAAGQTAPAAQPQVSGVNFGSAVITASAPGYTSGSQTVQVAASASFSPSSITITGVATQNLTLNLSAPAPAGGLTINLSSSNPGVATVPATVNFAALATSVSVPVTSVAAGTTTIHASALPNIADTTAAVTVTVSGGGGGISVTSATVGQNLEANLTVTLANPAPAGGLQITLSSGDASKLLLGGLNSLGQASLTFAITEGGTTATGIYAQALAGSGTVTVTATAGTLSGSGTITLSPSGFVLVGPNGPGVLSFSIGQGQTTPLTVSLGRLDSLSNFVQNQPLRGGFSVSVTVSSSNTSVGGIAGSPLTFNAGDQNGTVQFNAVNIGSTTLTAVPPTGFAPPAAGTNTQTVSVTPAGLVPTPVTVGQGLENTTNVTLNGAAPGGGLIVTIASNDTSKLLLSKTPTGVGQPSIDVTVPGGLTRTPDFYVYGLASSGTVTYNATASGFGSATGTVTLAQSGFVIQGPGGLSAASFLTTPGAPATALNVLSALLDTSRGFVSVQALAGGTSANVIVSSSNTNTGTITTSPVVVAGGSAQGTTAFQPAAAGTATLSVGAPPGFFTPAQFTSITAQVVTPGIGLPPDGTVFIGQNLQQQVSFSLGQLAPAGGVNVTLASNSAQLKLSNTTTGAGSDTITVNVPGGASIGFFYLQALGNSGTPTYTASAPGYTQRTSSITETPSGAVIGVPVLGLGFGFFTTSVAAGASPFPISMARLNPDNSFAQVQEVAGGQSATVTVTNSNSTVGTIATSVVIPGGSDTVTSNFTPLHTGLTVVSVVSPVTPTVDRSINVTVQ